MSTAIGPVKASLTASAMSVRRADVHERRPEVRAIHTSRVIHVPVAPRPPFFVARGFFFGARLFRRAPGSYFLVERSSFPSTHDFESTRGRFVSRRDRF